MTHQTSDTNRAAAAPALIVERRREQLEALAARLELAGIPALAATETAAALDLLRRHAPGVVLCELRMQPGGAIEPLTAIKAEQPGVPVVLMSAHADVPTVVAAMRAGAADFLQLPIEPQALVECVRRHLAQAPAREPATAHERPLDIRSLERAHIMDTLAAVNGSRKLAVQRLGISERTLRYKLQRYRLQAVGR